MIQFDDCWLEPRQFTICVMPKEGRSFKLKPQALLKHIKEVTDEIVESASEIRSMISAFNTLNVARKDQKLLEPMVKQVVDIVSLAKDEKDMKRKHRHQELQKTIKDITQELVTPDLISSLKDKVEYQKFWSTVDLKSYVMW